MSEQAHGHAPQGPFLVQGKEERGDFANLWQQMGSRTLVLKHSQF